MISPTELHLRPEWGLWLGLTQQILNLWSVRAYEGSKPKYPNRITGYPRGLQVSTFMCSIAEIRGLNPDQWLMAMNTSK